jgi:methionyl aminopeptidase
MHEAPSIPNDGRAGSGPALKAGMVFAIEPWLMRSTSEIYTDTDGWTLRSADGSRSAHVEHTVAITEDGPLVLTKRT